MLLGGVGIDDVAAWSLDLDDGTRDKITTFGTEEQALAHARKTIVGRDTTGVVKTQTTSDLSADREVAIHPATGATVTNRNTAVSTDVVFRVSSDKDLVNATFGSEITHGRLLLETRTYMSDKDLQNKKQTFFAPCLLQSDNITPLVRTPWAGHRIASHYKRGFGLPSHIGESWEVSVEPDFPSVTDGGRRLDELIAEDPIGWLGKHAEVHGGLGLLVKLLDASMALSVQIHPDDDDPALGADESGKPECWYILDADPGAGIYLGLAPGVDLKQMSAALEANADVARLLNFVPCKPGDFFVLPPGTPHAVGPGLTLIEPQRVLPGRRGLTYRYWDHGRRYDANGQLDPDGTPRPLHVQRALAVTDWEAPRGDTLVESLRLRLGPANVSAEPSLEPLCGESGGESGGLPFRYLSAQRVAGTGALEFPRADTCQSLTVVAGEVELDGVRVRAGRSALVPAAFSRNRTMFMRGAHALIAHLP